jgi:hypothetical protein
MMNLKRVLMFVGLLAGVSCDLAFVAAEDSADRSLAASMDRAWSVTWSRFYLPKTNFYFCLQAVYWKAGRCGLMK